MNKYNRRQALLGGSAALLLRPGLTDISKNNLVSREFFYHGVASGDPDSTSVVLWTKLTISSVEATGLCEISSSQGFEEIISCFPFKTSKEKDHTVKVLVNNLEPGSIYFYRFNYQGYFSSVGRTRTLPVGDISSLGLAVASCSNYPFGYFNAYEAISIDPSIDFVLHLGDYIYEYGPDGYGGLSGEKLGRTHLPGKEILSLDDYRTRHAQYKSDKDSQAMHAAHPLIVIWDDHEVTNNPWMGGAENHQLDEGSWEFRKKSALQAYYEWMPVREPEQGIGLENYWRNFQFGNLANLITLETRHSGRAQQVSYSEYLKDLKSKEDAYNFRSEILGAANRPMLSNDMKKFLEKNLKQSCRNSKRWCLIGNQIPMARTHAPEILDNFFKEKIKNLDGYDANSFRTFYDLGKLDLPIYLDTWDGYPLAREDFYQISKNVDVNDLLVLTGDSHAFWQNELFDCSGKKMGLELGVAAITSPGDFVSLGNDGATLINNQLAKHNKEIVWTNSQYNGYLRLKLTADKGRAEYISVTDISSKKYDVKVIREVEFVRSKGTLDYI